MSRRPLWPQTLRVFRWDLRYQLRDPRTLVLMVLGPVLLVPLMIWMAQSGDDRLDGQLDVVAGAPFSAWVIPEDGLRLVGGTLEEPEGDADPVAEVVVPADGAPYRIRYKGARLEGGSAVERIRAVLLRHEQGLQAARFAQLGLPPPDRILAAEIVDASSADARAGDLLGRLLPVVLLMLVMSGGLHTALDLITGERERGTLETLLSAPIDRRAVLYAKGLSVLMTAMFSTALALIGLAIAAAVVDVGGVGGDISALEPARVALAGGLMLPLLVMLTAGVMLLAARVPDYKAGQFLSAPAMLLGLLPAGLAAMPEIQLTAFLSLVPITGSALAVRSVLSGTADTALVLTAFGASVLHAAIAVRIAGGALTGERFLLGPPDRRARHARGDFALEAIGLFLVALLCIWFFGQTAQGLDLTWGMIITQLVTIALPAVAGLAWLGRPIAETMQLTAPRALDLVLAVVAGIAATGIGQLVFQVQAPIVPVPESFASDFAGQFEGFGLPMALFLFALLPGLCEEVLFRGALLGLLRPRFGPLALCLIVGGLFGVMHLAVPRLLPTAALGVLMTWAALRSGSLWVPVVMHTVHNGLLFTLALTETVPADATLPWFVAIGLSVLAIGLVWAMRGGRRPAD